jgi:3-dehydroquinate synthase
MDWVERTIQVTWPHRVLFADGVFNPGNPALRNVFLSDRGSGPRKTLFVLDEALARAYPGLAAQISRYCAAHHQVLGLVCPPLICEGGEQAKNSWDHVTRLHGEIDRHHIDRHSYLVAVGGGALLDMAGLAAATAHRGVRHIRMPTTTLSQCDSGVGVKNGVNAYGKKNFIGTFAPPFAVINDFQLLATLPAEHKRAGYAEAVKVACIRDSRFFEFIEATAEPLRRFETEPMKRLIRRCAELHLNHIADSGDAFEFGSARPLDFGHWSAHKLEQLSGFRLSHGEAVAIGLALDTLYSRRMKYLEAEEAERVLQLLEALGFDLFAPELLWTGSWGELRVLEGLEEFREHLGGRLALTLLREIGRGFEIDEMHRPELVQSIHELQMRHDSRARFSERPAA